ncbi:Pr6Pr family membrane protein [Nocardioides flavescens]|uniref:Uncharacterized protein n=1 Tax=Nocardioides flavescens TaxID=2691959 RepID=A0A6L7EVY8_9ACTN|nr:hypothetical protein [Nocardioides flavescens]
MRLAGLLGITVTALVHFFLLRPLQDLDGLDLLADTLLHVVVPLLAVAGWLLAGPRPRWDLATLAFATAWPLAWLGVTLVVGATTGWYPYPFLDVDTEGWGSVLVASLAVTALFGALAAVVRIVDVQGRPLPRRDRSRRE